MFWGVVLCVSLLSLIYLVSFADFIFLRRYFLSFSLINFLSSFRVLVLTVETSIVGKVKFSRIIFVLNFLFKGLDFALTHAFLSTGFGKFSTAGFVTGIVTVLALSFKAALVSRMGVIRLA